MSGARELGSFGKGDVVVREGTPCMVVEVSPRQEPADCRAWLCNLQTGSVWSLSASEQVWPCTDVKLSYSTARRC